MKSSNESVNKLTEPAKVVEVSEKQLRKEKDMRAKLNFMEKRVLIAQQEAVALLSVEATQEERQFARDSVMLYSKEIKELRNQLK